MHITIDIRDYVGTITRVDQLLIKALVDKERRAAYRKLNSAVPELLS